MTNITGWLCEQPDEDQIKNLLLECLEIQYENLEDIIIRPDESLSALRDIDNILECLKHKKVI